MPSYTRNKKRSELVFVLVNGLVYFGFKPKNLTQFSGISNTDITALGHILADDASAGLIKIIGAQAPKPPKVKKKLPNASVGQQQSISTFCAYNQLVAANAEGWNLLESRKSVTLRALSASRGSLTAIAKLSNDSLYCFPMNKADFEAYSAELGLRTSANLTDVERSKLVAGSSIPYPGRASKKLDDGSTFSSFFSTEKQAEIAEAGYDIVSEQKVMGAEQVPFFR